MTTPADMPLKIFCSYAHEDEAYVAALRKSLRPLERQGLIEWWYDREIVPGQEWREAIEENLQAADIILLLISPDFMASDFAYEEEMLRAIGRHERGEVSVIPIVVRRTDLEGAPFKHLQSCPKDLRPINAWSDRDEAWLDVARGIRKAINRLVSERGGREQEIAPTPQHVESAEPVEHAKDREIADTVTREALEAQELTQRVADIYAEGQRHMDAGEWQQALECFEEVQRREPGYRETEQLLSQVRRQLAALSPTADIDFRESDRRYNALKRQYDNGDISAQEFRTQLEQSAVQDAEGRWWVKHRDTGAWHYQDGDTWVQGTPYRESVSDGGEPRRLEPETKQSEQPEEPDGVSRVQDRPPDNESSRGNEHPRRLMPRLLSRLRGRIREPRRPGVATTIPQPITDDVHFTVVAPEQVLPEQPAPLDVYVHAMADVDAIIRRASREYGQPLRHRSKGPVPIQRGTIMVIRISVPRLDFEGEDLVYWTGILGNASFVLNVPAATEAGPYAGTVDVLVGGIAIARLQFVLEVGKARGEDVDVTSAMNWLRTAFASYASEDREQVLGRIQGMQKILPDLDVFLDVVSLRSGERWENRLQEEILARDAFYLFWSEAAMKSHWVNFEWHLALEARGENFIHPVPLSPPEIAPPPSELNSRHFRDWMLFLSNRSTLAE